MEITGQYGSQKIGHNVLEKLLEAGAEQAAVRTAKARTDEFNVMGEEVNLLRTVFTTSISMKALKDGKKGVVALNKADPEEIEKAIKTCMEALESADPDEAEGISELIENKSFVNGTEKADLNGLYDRVREFIGDVRKKYPKIVLEDLIAEYVEADVSYQNSNGVDFEEQYNTYGFSTTFSAHEGEKGSSFNYYGADFRSPDRPLIELGMTDALLEESEKSLEPTGLDGKFEGTLVFTPASIGFLIGNVCGLFLGDSHMIDGTCIWKDKLGEKVASENLSLLIDPDAEGVLQGGNHVTSDGYLIPKIELITNGILKNFMLSRYGAKKTGMKRTVSGAANIMILPGEEGLEEILSTVEKGLYVQRLSGGNPSVAGDFSGVAKNSFLIENGKITKPLKETMVSFNIADCLTKIRGISKETSNDSSGPQPWIAVDGVVISGK